ncbi:MAG: hypothetical protein ACLTJ8_07600 [Veillonella atypica]
MRMVLAQVHYTQVKTAVAILEQQDVASRSKEGAIDKTKTSLDRCKT